MDELEISPSCKVTSLEQQTRTSANLRVRLLNLSRQFSLGVLFFRDVWVLNLPMLLLFTFQCWETLELRGTMTLLGESSNLPEAPLLQHC